MQRKIFGINGPVPIYGPELHALFEDCFNNKDLEKLQKIFYGVCEGQVNQFMFRKNWVLISNDEERYQAKKQFARVELARVEEAYNTNNFARVNYQYDSLLQLAVEANWYEGVTYLINKKANLDQPNYSIRGYNNPSAPFYVDTNFSMHAVTTPLLTALGFKNEFPSPKTQHDLVENKKIIDLLIRSHANLHPPVTNGTTALHEAVKAGHTSTVIENLISRGAQLDAKNKDGNNPLFYASYDLAKILIAKGSQPSASQKQNIAFIESLENHLNKEILKRFKDNPLTKEKAEILEALIAFIKANLILSPQSVISVFSAQYKWTHRNQDPFAKLQEQRETRFFYSFFNPTYTATIQLFRNYLGEKKDELKPHLEPNKVRDDIRFILR